MHPLLVAAMIALGMFLLGWLALRHVDQAVRDRRPGWADPRHAEGVYCPHAKGELGEPGPPGSEEL